ncbi:enoyl-(acyl-carrier-protein) reductase [Gammaproteobacteria bacterium]
MSFLQGKRALICGVANNRSIAYGIAHAMRRQGAELAFTYQGEKLKERVERVAEEVGSDIAIPCDVGSDAQIQEMADTLAKRWDSLDILVHSIAFSPRDQLEGTYLEHVTRAGFATAHEISVYSFAALAKAVLPLMKGRNGAMLTLTYLGAIRAIPFYNVMGLAKAALEAEVRYMADGLGAQGIRVNGLSAGPVKTLAASGISDFRKLLDYAECNSPLRRNVTIEEIGNVAAFLCSDLASGITGEITYVDAGFNITGVVVPP